MAIAIEVFQTVEGGKWHRVWWSDEMESTGTVLTHVGVSYKPGIHPRRRKRSVDQSDLCRVCFPQVAVHEAIDRLRER